MLKSRASDIIKSFSEEERKYFGQFIRSPYFNSNKNLIKLYSVINEDFHRIDSEKMTEESLFAEIFPGKKYNYNIMKNLLSALAVLCEEFIVTDFYKRNRKNEFRNFLVLMNEFDTRHLDKYFNKGIKKYKEASPAMLIESDTYINSALLEESIYFFNSSRSDDKALEEAVYNELVYYICDFYRKLSRSMWKVDINKGNINSIYEKDFIKILTGNIDFESLMVQLKGIDEKAYNFIYLNNLLIKLVKKEEDTAPFYELKELVYKTIDGYENYERFSIFTKMLSYCASAYRIGKTEFLDESLDVRLFMMEKVKFNYAGQGPFNFHYFIETVLMLLLNRPVEEAQQYLEKYFNSVAPDKREITYNLSMAHIMEVKGEYNKAIEFLSKTAHTDTEVKGWIKRLYIRTYYSLNEFEPGIDAVKAFISFVKDKNDLNAHARVNYSSFAAITEKMFRIKAEPEKYDTEDVNKLIRTVEENNFISKKWQLEKLNELKGIVK